EEKPPWGKRISAGVVRFGKHTKNAITHSWTNVLLIFVPIGIAMEAAGMSATLVFAMNAIAIVPLAGLLSHATEAVAARMGDTWGALLNVSFGNAVELIIFVIALVKKEIRIVQASLLGSILANLLLILGMSFLFGGLLYREQIYNSTVTQMSACLLSLSVMSLLLPTAFHASFNEQSSSQADRAVLYISRGTSVILLVVYVLYLLFQLKSHAYLYESTPQEVIDEESHPGVLADIMNSSSSDDDSASDSASDSGSILTSGKKLRKKMFKHRRHRKSNASNSSMANSSVGAAASSPSTERRGSYLENVPSNAVIDDGDDEGGPRIRDFVTDAVPAEDSKKSVVEEPKKKKKRKHRKQRTSPERTAEQEKPVEAAVQAPPLQVNFAEEPDTPGKPPSNKRGLPRHYRPALPKMLTNTVFTTPRPEPLARPVGPVRTRSAAPGLRRATSLPDFPRPQAPSLVQQSPVVNSPLPPYVIRRRTTEPSRNGEQEDQEPSMSRTAAVVLLLLTTALVAVCAEFMVDAIPSMIKSSPVSQAFIGLIILPIVGNAAEHVTAVTVAMKNKMDLSIGVAVGSSIQIALFVTPIVVLLGWILDTEMSLYFNLFETVSLFVTAFVVNFLVLDGRSNYLEGSLLIASYIIIAVGVYFYPTEDKESQFGGGV
ncbi:calcium/proton exchanger, partial [Piedraia hortae CBS 480.64]